MRPITKSTYTQNTTNTNYSSDPSNIISGVNNRVYGKNNIISGDNNSINGDNNKLQNTTNNIIQGFDNNILNSENVNLVGNNNIIKDGNNINLSAENYVNDNLFILKNTILANIIDLSDYNIPIPTRKSLIIRNNDQILTLVSTGGIKLDAIEEINFFSFDKINITSDSEIFIRGFSNIISSNNNIIKTKSTNLFSNLNIKYYNFTKEINTTDIESNVSFYTSTINYPSGLNTQNNTYTFFYGFKSTEQNITTGSGLNLTKDLMDLTSNTAKFCVIGVELEARYTIEVDDVFYIMHRKRHFTGKITLDDDDFTIIDDTILFDHNDLPSGINISESITNPSHKITLSVDLSNSTGSTKKLRLGVQNTIKINYTSDHSMDDNAGTYFNTSILA